MNLEILKIASNTKNFKDIKKYTHHSKSKNPFCGDEIHIKLVISDQKIIDFGYQENHAFIAKQLRVFYQIN